MTWLVGQLLKLRIAVEKHQPSGLFEHGHERCLILAPTHQSLLDIGSPLHIPAALDLEARASWLRERTLELYKRAKPS